MKKDIQPPKVTNIAVAIVPDKNELNQEEWNVYLINLKEDTLENVLVSSKGYGESEGRKLETTELRHYFETLPALSFVKVEPIMEDVFRLTNQFWVSFFLGKEMQDKKFIFVPESISEKNFIDIPIIQKKGVLIR